MDLPVVHYDAERVASPNPRGETPYEAFEEVRQDLLEACRRFGAAGPDGSPKNMK